MLEVSTGESDIPHPAVVSREDVASMAVQSALFRGSKITGAVQGTPVESLRPFHLQLSMRMIDASATKTNGHRHVRVRECMDSVFKEDTTKFFKKKKSPTDTEIGKPPKSRRKLKPYAPFVAFPFYLCFWMSAFFSAKSLTKHLLVPLAYLLGPPASTLVARWMQVRLFFGADLVWVVSLPFVIAISTLIIEHQTRVALEGAKKNFSRLKQLLFPPKKGSGSWGWPWDQDWDDNSDDLVVVGRPVR
mmetsp:Transcript_28419/g.65981  ORF Transcript_28419/g.65981 Transcript_28419/m.65981 type:complete len:246 (+) Transcript_28419:869-1606(+)